LQILLQKLELENILTLLLLHVFVYAMVLDRFLLLGDRRNLVGKLELTIYSPISFWFQHELFLRNFSERKRIGVMENVPKVAGQPFTYSEKSFQ
jgi:hypothetical protein